MKILVIILFAFIFVASGEPLQILAGTMKSIDTNRQLLMLHRNQREIDIANALMPIEDRISKIESLDSLENREHVLETFKDTKYSSWWHRLGNFILSVGFITAIITLIIGFFKWLLEWSKFRHERKLSSMEHQNKWRSEYLTKALDPMVDLSIRIQFLRFLKGTAAEDFVVAKWADEETAIIQMVFSSQIDYQQKKAEIAGLQKDLSISKDLQRISTLKNNIQKMETDMATIRSKLYMNGYSPDVFTNQNMIL